MKIYKKTLEGKLKWTEQKNIELSEEYSAEQLKKKKDNLLRHKINLQSHIVSINNELVDINVLITEAKKLGIKVEE